MCWHFAKSSLLLCLLIFATPSPAVDAARLWLPTTYKTLYLPLKEAAQAAQNLERCVTILEGTIDLALSQPGHAIFRILCRQEDGSSYNEMVDGRTFETLTTSEPLEELTPEALARQQQKEQARQQAEREAHFQALWYACSITLTPAIQHMIDLTWVTDEPSEPAEEITSAEATPSPPGEIEPTETNEGTEEPKTLIFHRDFNAKDVWGKTLHYRVVCQTKGLDEVEIRIVPRPRKQHTASVHERISGAR